MANTPKITVNAQPVVMNTSNITGAQSKAVILDMSKKLQDNSTPLDEACIPIYISSPGANDRNQTLLERGVSVVRPEIIAATEFIPLVKDNDASDATFTMASGDQEYKVDITNAARLIEMQLVAQKMLMKNVEKVLNSYASENLSALLKSAQLHLKSGYVEAVKVTNFETMKSKIKQILESAQVEVPEPVGPVPITGMFQVGLTANTGINSSVSTPSSSSSRTPIANRATVSATNRSEYLAEKFKTMDSEYSNLIIEYLTRRIIVTATNEFLAELASIKVATVNLFEILNTNIDSLGGSTNSSIQEIIEHLQSIIFQPIHMSEELTNTSYTKFIMTGYIESQLKTSLSAALSSGVSSKNILHVVKALSSDLQVKKRHLPTIVLNDSSTSIVPQTVDSSYADTLVNGMPGYQTFNVASYFGNPTQTYNMVTRGNGGTDFSEHAYARVKLILAACDRHFNEMLGDHRQDGIGPTMKFLQGIVPLLGKVVLDMSIHNNMSNFGMGDYKSIQADGTNSNIAAGTSGILSIEGYCSAVLYKHSLTATQDTDAVLTKDAGDKSYFVNQVLSAISPASVAPNVVLPMERLSAKLDFDGQNYIPGAGHYFDEGVRALVNLSNSDSGFTSLSTKANEYDAVTSNILSDFKMMRGLNSVGKNKANNARTADNLIDRLNIGLADLLDTHLMDKTPEFKDLFSLVMIAQAGDNSYFFSTLMTFFKMRAIAQTLTDEESFEDNLQRTKATGKLQGLSKTKNSDTAIFNAFSIDWKDDNQKRQETYKKGYGEERNSKYEEKVSIAKYCLSYMFLRSMMDVMELPNNRDKEHDALKNDFHMWKKKMPVVNKTLNSSAIEGYSTASLSSASASENKFFKKEFEGFVDALMGLPHIGILVKLFDFIEDFEKNNMSDKYLSSTGTSIGTFKTGGSNDEWAAAAVARSKMEVNGGKETWQEKDNGTQAGHSSATGNEGFLNLNTNRSRTYLGLNSTIDTRQFAMLSYCMSILNKIAVVKIDHTEKSDKLKLTGYRKVTASAIAALRGEGFTSSKHVNDIYYDIKTAIGALKAEANNNTVDCFKHLLLLKGQAHSIKSKTQEIDRFIKGTSGGHDYRQALKYYEESGIGKRLLSFISPTMVASNKYSELSLITNSREMPLFPSCDAYSSQQLKNMITYFDQTNKGFYSNANNPVLDGRKTVMHVGIPAGMLENLQFDSISKTGDESYDGSNLIMLTIYRKDVLNSKSYVYPKTFVFDMSRFTIEGAEGISASQLSGQTFLSADELIENSTIYKIDGFGTLHKMPDGHAYNTGTEITVSPYKLDFRKAVFNNHIADHYYKMYFKLMTGLDFKEYVFQLTKDSALMNGPDGSNVDLLNKIREANLLLFPNAFKDPASATELEKINRGISNTLFFNSERYMKASIYPNIFDRVFSVLINERDFIYSSGNSATDKTASNYGSAVAPSFKIDLGIEAIAKLNIPESRITNVQRYYNSSRDKNYPQIYMYYAQVTLMKRIEKPDY